MECALEQMVMKSGCNSSKFPGCMQIRDFFKKYLRFNTKH